MASALAPELNFKMPIGGSSEEREEHKPEEEERGEEEEEEEEEFLSRGRTGERTDGRSCHTYSLGGMRAVCEE